MRPTRKCEFCGKTFVPRSGMQKYCSEECQAEAKRLRKKRQQDLINGIEPIMNLQHQEYLTFSKAAKNGAKPPTKNGDTRSLFYHPVLFGGKDTIFSVLNCHN